MYIYIYIYIFIGSASAADLFFLHTGFHQTWHLGAGLARRLPNAARRVPGCRNSTNWKPLASQMGAKRPRRLISLIFIDFHRFSFILKGFRDIRACGGQEFGQPVVLWRPVATCRNQFHICPTPLRWCNKASCTLQYRKIAICRMGDCKVLQWWLIGVCMIERYWLMTM